MSRHWHRVSKPIQKLAAGLLPVMSEGMSPYEIYYVLATDEEIQRLNELSRRRRTRTRWLSADEFIAAHKRRRTQLEALPAGRCSAGASKTLGASLGNLRPVARASVFHGLRLRRSKAFAHLPGAARGIDVACAWP